LVATCLHKEENAELVEKVGGDRSTQPTAWLARPASTWRQTDFSKSVEIPFTPINTPLMVKVSTPHFTCSSPLVKLPI
jgi:hypothetical protein